MGDWGLSRSGILKITKTGKGLGPYETHLALIQARFLLSQGGWELQPYLQESAGQTVNSFDNLEFSQAGTLRLGPAKRCGFELLVFCSSLYKPRWRLGFGRGENLCH